MRFLGKIRFMRLVWIVIPFVLFGIIGIQESFAEQASGKPAWETNSKKVCGDRLCSETQELSIKGTGHNYQILLSDVEGNTSIPEFLGEERFITFHSSTSFNNQGNPIEAEIRIVCGPNNKILYNETKLFTISNPRTMIDSFTPIFSGHYTIIMMTEEISPISTMFTISGNPDNHCNSEFIKNLPPLKQISAGIFSENVICKEGLQLITKYDGSPACVTIQTAENLEERGWGKITSISSIPIKVSSITNFEECISAGNLIMESYPRQCRTNDGKHFVEEISSLEVKIDGEKQVRRGTTQTLQIQVLRDETPIERARVFIDIEDYGEDIIKEFDGYTNSQGIFVFSWEIPQRFDDLENLLAIIDVTDNVSSKTTLFKFQVYCLPGERDCKVEGN